MAKAAPVKTNAALRDDSEHRILDAAVKLFAAHGFKGASLQMIAASADLPKANLLYYFSTKQELYRRVIEHVFQIWEVAAESFVGATDPVVAISGFIEQRMEIARSFPEGNQIWGSEVAGGAKQAGDYLDGVLDGRLRGHEAMIRDWVETGKLAPINPKNLLFMLFAIPHYYAAFSREIASHNDGNPLSDRQWQDAKRDVIAIVLRGVLPSPPSHSPASDN